MSFLDVTLLLAVAFVVFGLAVGILFGFFGMGGSFFVTPSLLVLGLPIPTAVGTGLAFVFWTSLTASVSHRNLHHIDYRLGFLLILGMIVGIELGRRTLLTLVAVGIAKVTVSLVYVILLASVGVFVVRDGRHPAIENGDIVETEPSFATLLQRIYAPPMISLQSGVTLSVWVILSIAVLIGILSGFLGVGGGFVMLPTLMYGLGTPGAAAVGTDIFQITVSSAYGAFVYGQQGAIHFAMLLPLLVGSTVGTPIGAVLTDHLDDSELRTTFGVMLLLGSVSVASNTVSHTYGIRLLNTLSLTLLLGGALVMSTIIIYLGMRSMREERVTV